MTDEPELETGHAPTLDGIAGGLAAEAHYQSPGGRGFLLAAALLAGVPRGARVLDVGCGMGAAAIDLAEAFACRMDGFDAHGPYIAQAAQTAKARGVGGLVSLRDLDAERALATYPQGAYDVVFGLGGVLSHLLPGGRIAGLAAAATWLSLGGVLICSDLVATAPPSDLLRAIFGEALPTESTYWTTLGGAGFNLVFAARATRGDLDAYHLTIDRLSGRPHLDPRIVDPDPHHQHLIEAAHLHPEVAYLNMVLRKRG